MDADKATDSAAPAPLQPARGEGHPIGLYLKVWGLLFVLSTLSYLVDYFHVQGLLRWSLIVIFMLLKAGLIVAVFMHMAWERLALVCAILLPPLALLVLVALMAIEAGHTQAIRQLFFR
jgi:cytochrome c oxidase subunit IV